LASLALRRVKTADVLRVPTADNLPSDNKREAKVKRNGVNLTDCCFFLFF